MYGCEMEGRGVMDGHAGAPRLQKTLSHPQAAPPRLGGHQQIITFKCKLDRGKRWKHENKLDISIGGVQLEKMSISY